MDSYQQEILQIKQILRDNPKGMTVTDISRKIKVNRNSVAKYLDIMRISGMVEMITFGPAKVFFPSRRVPVLHMLNFTSDYILIFDKDLKIILINDTCLEFMKAQREELIGQIIDNTIFSFLRENSEIENAIDESLEGKTKQKEVFLKMDDGDIYFTVKIIPTTFEDGRHGVTVILKNNTSHKIAENALRESEENFRKLLDKMSNK